MDVVLIVKAIDGDIIVIVVVIVEESIIDAIIYLGFDSKLSAMDS